MPAPTPDNLTIQTRFPGAHMSSWQLQEAKARFSELIRRARQDGPQDITVHGKPVAVLLSREEYERLRTRKPDLVTFMRASPLYGLDLDFTREQDTGREPDFDFGADPDAPEPPP